MMTTPHRRARRLAAALLATALLAASPTGAAVAQKRSMQPARTGTDMQMVSADDSRYRSLTLNVASWQADRSGDDLAGFLAANQLASPDLQLPSRDLSDVAGRLAASGALPELSIANGFDQYRQQLAADTSLDAAASSLGARFATTAAGLKTGDLAVPALPQGQFTQLAPDDALVFGELYKNSLTVLAADNAEQLDAERLDRAAFDEARAHAAELTTAGLGESLAAPCHASLIVSAATGNRNSARDVTGNTDCGACETAGLYMHGEWNRLLDLNWDTLGINSSGDAVTLRDLDALDPDVRAHLKQTRPDLADDVDGLTPDRASTPGSVTSACSGADAAADAAAKQMVPDATDALSRLFD